jgi:hypothetical protein
MKGRASTVVLSCAAGLGFTGVALASRGIGADDISWPLLLNPLLWAIIVHGAIGIAFFTVALQRDAVTLVTAITFVFEVVVPSVIGIVLFGDAIAPGRMPLAIAGFVLAIGGRRCHSAVSPSEPASRRDSHPDVAAAVRASPLSR